MAAVDMIKSCQNFLYQISDQVAGAIIYLDAGSAEAFQFVGGLPVLLELGARAICSLEHASSLDVVIDWNVTSEEPVLKMVVMTSRLLSDAHRYILRCLHMHRSIRQCTIFTSISEKEHSAYVDAPLGPDAFQEYEALLVQDYQELVLKSDLKQSSVKADDCGQPLQTKHTEDNVAVEEEDWLPLASNENMISSLEVSSPGKSTDSVSPTIAKEEAQQNLTVSVKHFPMILCPLSPKVFVLPSEGAVAEACISDKFDNSLSPGLPPVSMGLATDGEDIPPGAVLIAHFLHHLASQMDLKMDIFSLGPLSHIIGKILTDLSSLYDVGGRTKHSTGLLLIDRSLDLITPCCHGDSLVDHMFSSLPRRERSTTSPHLKDNVATHKVTSGLQRAPIDVRIPLESILKIDNSENSGGHFYHESLDAFISGWNGNFNLGISHSHDEKNKDHIMEKRISHLDPMYGSLASCGNHQGVHCLEALLDRQTKDGALLIRKWLQEALRQEKVNITGRNRFGAVTASELHSLVNALALSPAMVMRNRGIIQLAKAAEVALSEPWSTRWEAFASAERIMMLSAGDTSQSLSGQIRDLINQSVLWRTQNRGERQEPPSGLLSVRDAIILAIVGYCLAGESFGSFGFGGPFSWEEEHSLKEAIVDAVLECSPDVNLGFLHGLEGALEAHWQKSHSKNIKEAHPDQPSDSEDHSSIDFDDQWGNWEEEEVEGDKEEEYGELQLKLELRDRLDSVFKVLHKVSDGRRNLSFKDRRSALDDNSGGATYTSKGLIYKLLSMVFSKSDIPGLEYHSSAMGRFFKSGFGRFGLGQAKPRLGDQSVILVFVVGGFNALEVLEAREAQLTISGAKGVELLLGGTTILTPNDMFDLLLGPCSYI